MSESVRLVIWDLDDTFWKGTLTEGGIQTYLQSNHDIVVALAHRGIISSICSKNDWEQTKEILEKKGIWQYFAFPSIEWTSKGPRLAQLVHAIQLRPQNVLFIDDNPHNRAEIAAILPGIQVADERILPELLTDIRMTGKNDPELTRLSQYKMLERRKEEAGKIGGDNTAFLRMSDIRVVIEHDVERHLDRAIELINRTNQLNFTKLRLPENLSEARAELRTLTDSFAYQAGLIKVIDNYGDYGYCGFYLKRSDNRLGIGPLLHFCFSCRILGMGIEQWVYQTMLGWPPIEVRGDVLTDVKAGGVDWITLSTSEPTTEDVRHESCEVRFRGGCEVSAVAHYFRLENQVTCVETNYQRDAFIMRYDCSVTLLNALAADPRLLSPAERLEIPPADIRSAFFAEPLHNTTLVASLWGDIYAPTHRHRALGAFITVGIDGMMGGVDPHQPADYGNWPVAVLSQQMMQAGFDEQFQNRVKAVAQELRENFDYLGALDPSRLAQQYASLFDQTPHHCTLYLVMPDLYGGSSNCGYARPEVRSYIDTVARTAEGRSNIVLVDIADCVHDKSERHVMGDHFTRIVYFRLAEKIKSLIKSRR